MVSVRCSPRLIPLPGSRTGGTSERAATITVRCSGTGAPERGVPGRGFPAPARCSGSGVGRWGFEGGAASPSPAAMLNIAWAGLTTVQWLKPAPAEPLKRLSGHRSERRTPARRGQAPRPLGRLPRRRRRAASHFWVTARSLPRTAFSPYPVPLGDRRSSIWGDSGARIAAPPRHATTITLELTAVTPRCDPQADRCTARIRNGSCRSGSRRQRP